MQRLLFGPLFHRCPRKGSHEVSLGFESPNYFTKFAGFDANGDIFGNNDRVGIEPRNTFKGDSYQTIDLRLSRTFKPTERMRVETIADGLQSFQHRQRQVL